MTFIYTSTRLHMGDFPTQSSYGANPFMSYVIQNFTTTSPIKVWNQRSQLLFILRNLYTIIFWSLKTFSLFLSMFGTCTNIMLLHRLSSKLYSRGFTSVLTKVGRKWKFFNAININKSLEYWVFRKGLLLLDFEKTTPLVNSLTLKKEVPFLNQYYSTFLLSNISLHRKPFRTVLFKQLTSLLLFWQSWNKNHKISFRFMLGTQELYLLYFYNMYIFKIYHL